MTLPCPPVTAQLSACFLQEAELQNYRKKLVKEGKLGDEEPAAAEKHEQTFDKSVHVYEVWTSKTLVVLLWTGPPCLGIPAVQFFFLSEEPGCYAVACGSRLGQPCPQACFRSTVELEGCYTGYAPYFRGFAKCFHLVNAQ